MRLLGDKKLDGKIYIFSFKSRFAVDVLTYRSNNSYGNP